MHSSTEYRAVPKSRVSSLYLDMLGGENGMRDTMVEWMEFTLFFITYV
jgi:hypothetical protein